MDMMEQCTGRRMLVAGASLLAATALVIALEDWWMDSDEASVTLGGYAPTATAAPSSSSSSTPVAESADGGCTVVAHCQRCNLFEMRVAGACKPTAYYDRLRCGSGANATSQVRPCYEKQSVGFDVLLAAAPCFTVIFTALTFWRQSVLSKIALDRLQQHVSAGV